MMTPNRNNILMALVIVGFVLVGIHASDFSAVLHKLFGAGSEAVKAIATVAVVILVGIGSWRTKDLDGIENEKVYRFAFALFMARGTLWVIEGLRTILGV